MALNKLKNVTVRVRPDITTNPFKKGSFKHVLMAEALKRGTFTRSEFETFLLELKTINEVESAMPDTILVKAWWSELTNKAKVFESVD